MPTRLLVFPGGQFWCQSCVALICVAPGTQGIACPTDFSNYSVPGMLNVFLAYIQLCSLVLDRPKIVQNAVTIITCSGKRLVVRIHNSSTTITISSRMLGRAVNLEMLYVLILNLYRRVRHPLPLTRRVARRRNSSTRYSTKRFIEPFVIFRIA